MGPVSESATIQGPSLPLPKPFLNLEYETSCRRRPVCGKLISPASRPYELLGRTRADLEDDAGVVFCALLRWGLLSLRCAHSDRFLHGLSIAVRAGADCRGPYWRRIRHWLGLCRHSKDHMAVLCHGSIAIRRIRNSGQALRSSPHAGG